MVRNILFSLTVALLVVTTMTARAEPSKMMLSGSTTFQSRILEPAREAIRTATGIDIAVEGVGSGNGLKRLAEGSVPAAIVSSPLSGLLKNLGLPGDAYQEHEILRDDILPIINPNNPVERLTWEQLSNIFTAKVKNWKEVGGPDLEIIVITSHAKSATREVVLELVMKKQPYSPFAEPVNTTQKEMVKVAKRPGAIGAVSKGFVDAFPGKVKVVQTADISRPLSIVTKGDPTPEVARLIAFLRQDEARRHFK